MTASPKLDAFLRLAAEVIMAAETLARHATEAMKVQGYALKLRDKVVVALALKILGAFRALVDDCRSVRLESVHHLKTMVESFIYQHVAFADITDAAAKSILAEVYYRKLAYLRENPEIASDTDTAAWQHALEEIEHQGIQRIGTTPLEQLSRKHSDGLGAWYSRAYRYACEPAHIADLVEFLPGSDGIRTGGPTTAALRATISMDWALQVMIDMMDALTEDNELGLTASVEPLRTRLAEIRAKSPEV